MTGKAGRSAMPFDRELSSDMDLLSPSGFCNALFYACNLRPGTGHMSAPVCSTWVFMLLRCIEHFEVDGLPEKMIFPKRNMLCRVPPKLS